MCPAAGSWGLLPKNTVVLADGRAERATPCPHPGHPSTTCRQRCSHHLRPLKRRHEEALCTFPASLASTSMKLPLWFTRPWCTAVSGFLVKEFLFELEGGWTEMTRVCNSWGGYDALLCVTQWAQVIHTDTETSWMSLLTTPALGGWWLSKSEGFCHRKHGRQADTRSALHSSQYHAWEWLEFCNCSQVRIQSSRNDHLCVQYSAHRGQKHDMAMPRHTALLYLTATDGRSRR